MARFVTFRRGGQPGKVAINTEQVTDVRSSPGPYTDVYCGAHQITVEGSFEQVVASLAGVQPANDKPPSNSLMRPF